MKANVSPNAEALRPQGTSFLLAPGARWFLAKVTQVAAEWSLVLS